MFSYIAGGAALLFVYTLIMACYFDGKERPASPQTVRRVENHGPAQTWWDRAPDWVVAVAAVIALWIYITQANHMKAANSYAQTEQRAWIAISNPNLDKNSVRTGTAMRTTFTIHNLGLTPARVRWSFVRAVPILRWKGFSRDVALPSPASPNPTIVTPKEAKELVIYDFNFDITAAEATDADLTLMVQFVVNYLDAFDRPCVTVACYTYDLKRDAWNEFGMDDCLRME